MLTPKDVLTNMSACEEEKYAGIEEGGICLPD